MMMWRSDFSQITSSAEGELALPPSSFITTGALTSHHLCVIGRASLIFYFIFIFTCDAFLRMNKMYRSHPVTTEWYLNHVSGMNMLSRVPSDAAWSTADTCYPASPNRSPPQGHTQHTASCIWLPRAARNIRSWGRCPCLVTISELLVLYLPDSMLSWLYHFGLIRAELSRSKTGSLGVIFRTESSSWQQKKQVLPHTITWNNTAAGFL